ALGGSKERRSGARVDSSCLLMTLNSGLDKRRSNSLSTRGCGERRQIESLDEVERFVATLLRVGKTGRVGKELWGRCSRIVTDRLDEFSGDSEQGSGTRERKAAGFP